jgi:DNA polymerase IV
LDPSLRGKPVIVGGNPNGRGVVAAASYAARKYGIHSAMPLFRARRLCPSAIFLRGSHRYYNEFSCRIFDILRGYSPLVEPISIDEAYVDLTGCIQLHGSLLDAAQRMRDEIREQVGINSSIGIATNKLVAKVASTVVKPSGMLWITPGMERRFLAPLGVECIPGIGPKSTVELRRMGVCTVMQLSEIPLEWLEQAYGKWGSALYLKAQGTCDNPVFSEGEDSRSISRETTLLEDSVDPRYLESTLSYLVEKAVSQLRIEKLYARLVTLKLRYSDFKTVTRCITLRESTDDDRIILREILRLFRKLFIRRTCVRLTGVSLSSLSRIRFQQTDLFEQVSFEQRDRLFRGIDGIRDKYGFHSILKAGSFRGSSK